MISADSMGRRLFLQVSLVVDSLSKDPLRFNESSDTSRTHPAFTHSPRPLNNMATLTRMALGRNIPIFMKVPGLVEI